MKKIILIIFCALPIFGVFGDDSSANKVIVKETPKMIRVIHGDMTVEFGLSKKLMGRITSIQFAGKNYLNSKGTYIRSFGMPMKDGQPMLDKKEAKKIVHKWSHKIIREKDYTEIRFSEKATQAYPMSTDIGWIFKHGEPGIYYYLSYHHPENFPDMQLQQTRMSIMVPTNAFQKARIADDRIYDVVPIGKWQGYRQIMDATYLLKNEQIITKYSWSTRKEKQRFYGYAGRGMGIFQHFGSMEHVNGGANKQSNTAHHTPDGPIILNVMSSSHYGAGMTDIKGEWKKLYGPFLLSFANKTSWQENVATAEKKQAKLEKAWPLRWFKHPQYAIDRGQLKGSVRINAKPAANALVLLSPQKAENMSESLNHGLGYMYWARTDAQGNFSIAKIVPGHYYATINQPGVFGDFHTSLDKPYAVKVGQTKDIGQLEFTEKTFGKLLWKIGTPDRDSAEFRGAQDNGFRPYGGLWKLKEINGGDHPVFKVGVSDPAKDFYYAHPISGNSLQDYIDLALNKPKTDYRAFTQSPKRIIEFKLPTQPKGEYLLTIALAGNRDSTIRLLLNGKHVEDFQIPWEGGGGVRSGSYGRSGEWRVLLPSKQLKKGVNRIQIQHKKGLVLKKKTSLKGPINSAFLYDAIKLEHKARPGSANR